MTRLYLSVLLICMMSAAHDYIPEELVRAFKHKELPVPGELVALKTKEGYKPVTVVQASPILCSIKEHNEQQKQDQQKVRMVQISLLYKIIKEHTAKL